MNALCLLHELINIIGVIEVGFDYCNVYSNSSKSIGSAQLNRSDDDGDEEGGGKNQKVTIKKKEVYFQEGFSVVVGSKLVEV